MPKNLSAPSAPAEIKPPSPRDLNPPAPTGAPRRAVAKPRRATPAVKAPEAPPTRPPVVLLVKPQGTWSVAKVGDPITGERYLLPRIVEHPCVAGGGGVSIKRDGTFNIDGLEADTVQAGGFLLPWELGYCLESPPGSGFFVMAWESVTSTGEVVCTLAGRRVRRDWFLGLMADGTIPSPHEGNLEELRSNLLDLLLKAEKAEGNPDIAAAVRADLAFVEGELEKLRAADGYTAPEDAPEAAPIGFGS